MYSAIVEGAHWGMQTMNQALLKLYRQGLVSADHCMHYAGNYTEMRQMLRLEDGCQDKADADARGGCGRRQAQGPQTPAAAAAAGCPGGHEWRGATTAAGGAYSRAVDGRRVPAAQSGGSRA